MCGNRFSYSFCGDRVMVMALTFLILGAALVPTAAIAQQSGPSEYQVKAAFLYNFTKYVEWPDSAFADAGSPFVIGVVGRDPFGSALDRTVDGRTVNGRSIEVRRFRRAEDVSGAHILFVSDSESDRVAKIIEHLGNAHTLVVGDMDEFLERGGTINFLIEDSRVRFEINTDASDRAGLTISSKLLALARSVRSRHG